MIREMLAVDNQTGLTTNKNKDVISLFKLPSLELINDNESDIKNDMTKTFSKNDTLYPLMAH